MTIADVPPAATDDQVRPDEGVWRVLAGLTDMAAGVVTHRDIKPAEMALTPGAGHAAQIDFALTSHWLAQGLSTQLWPRIDLFAAEGHVAELRTIRQQSRWRAYVSERLKHLGEAANEASDSTYPRPEIVLRAGMLAEYLFTSDTPTPSVVPSEEGGVSFVWHKGGLDVDIEVGDEDVYVCVYLRSSGESFYGSLRERFAETQAVLQYLSTLP